MSLKVGIVGLPNVGKSTLFNALLKKQAAYVANFPFATIEFFDIAGLIAGAHKGEGLGNKFLAHIRETDAVAHVLRDFSDPEIMREGSMDPKQDFATVETELQLADLQTLEKQAEPKGAVSKEEA